MSNTELIAEARSYVADWVGDYEERGADMVTRLADALEAEENDCPWKYIAEKAVAAASPRVVSTIAELDALPRGSVVLDSEPAVMYCNHEDGEWWVPGSLQSFGSDAAILPVTVLWVGGTE